MLGYIVPETFYVRLWWSITILYYNLTDVFNQVSIVVKTNSPSSCVTMSRSVVQLILVLTIIDRCASNRLFASDIEKRYEKTLLHSKLIVSSERVVSPSLNVALNYLQNL